MKKSEGQPADAARLRRRAEGRLKRQRPAGGGQTAGLETARAVHELQVHQIELEMQNEELRQARAQMETLLAQYTDLYDFAPTGYMTLDREGTIRQVNLTGASLFGVERSRLVNRRFGLLVPEGDRRMFSDFVQKVFASRAKERCDVTLLREGAPPLVLQIEGACTADGQECRAVVLDITERTELQAQLAHAQKMESVGRLAGGIAHDFNNLLTVINGTADLAMTELPEGHSLRADLQEIRHAGDRATVLTRQLLAFSRKQVLQPVVLSLNTVIADMQSMLRRLIGEDVGLVFVPAEDLGLVRADLGQIEQVLLNLAVNARDAMAGGGSLTIATRNVELDEAYAEQHPSVVPGDYVLFSVSDTGVGIGEAAMARMFEPFFTTKGPGAGTGLGLSTAYGIVTQSGGTIWAYSEVGKGSIFNVCLPRVAGAAGTDRSARTAPVVGGTETVLVVEDEEGLRQLATRVLVSAGYTVLAATNGGEALSLLERFDGPVHLMFTDVVMPGMSGRHLADRLREIRPDTKVLFSSGYMDDAILRHGVLTEATHFIGKPYAVADLKRKVREVLDRQG